MDIFDPDAIRFRAEMIELMMTSHPHDCPVCDEGGECHLQDMTVMTGHSYRRYRGRKRTFVNQDLGPFVTHELNRCITCYRCTRFYNDYAGGRDFGVFGLRNQVYFGRAESGTLESEFSGNLIEVCPTGVFDDKPFSRRYTRKWDLQSAPSVCPNCGLGCTTYPSSRYGELRRVLSRFNRDVNKMFLCDRGRFGFEFVNCAGAGAGGAHRGRPAAAAAGGGDGRRPEPEAATASRPEPPTEDEARDARRRALGPAAAGDRRPGRRRGRRAQRRPRAGRRGGAAARPPRRRLRLAARVARGQLRAPRAGRAAELPPRHVRRRRPPGRRRAGGRRRPAPAAGVGGRHRPGHRRARPRRGPHQHRADAGPHRPHLAAPAPQRGGGAQPHPALERRRHHAHQAPRAERPLGRDDARHQAGRRGRRGAPGRAGRPRAPGAGHRARGGRRVARRAGPRRRRARACAALGRRADRRPVARGRLRLLQRLGRSAAGGRAARGGAAPRGADGVRSEGLRGRRAGHPGAHRPRARQRRPQDARRRQPGAGPGRRGARRGRGGRRARQRPAPPRAGAARRRPDPPRPLLITLATLEDGLTAQADVVLPTATFAEETGTHISHEGRAQRYFAVLPPRDDVRPAWRWLRELAGAHGAARGARLEDAGRRARGARTWNCRGSAASRMPRRPPAGAQDGRKVARQPLRWSGRTALDADRTVFEPGPTPDPDSALAYSVEGLQPQQSPDALRTRAWWPGWNSSNGLHKFGEELEALGPAEPSGVRVLDGAAPGRELPPFPAPARFAPQGRRLRAGAGPRHLRLGAAQHVHARRPRTRAGAVHRPERRGRGAAGRARGRPARAVAAVDGRARAACASCRRSSAGRPGCPSACPASPTSRSPPACG